MQSIFPSFTILVFSEGKLHLAVSQEVPALLLRHLLRLPAAPGPHVGAEGEAAQPVEGAVHRHHRGVHPVLQEGAGAAQPDG